MQQMNKKQHLKIDYKLILYKYITMRRNKKVLSMSSFKTEPTNKQIEKQKPEPIKQDTIKTDMTNMKKSNERDMKYNKLEKKIIQTQSKPTLKLFKELFDNAEDKIQFLTDNANNIKSLNKKHQKMFIDYIKNTYT